MPLLLSEEDKRELAVSGTGTVIEILAASLQLHKTRILDLLQAFDTNNDGEVSRSELSEGLRAMGVKATDAQLEAALSRAGSDLGPPSRRGW